MRLAGKRVAIVGAGFTGLVTALLAARQGATVTILEAGTEAGASTSSHNFGQLHSGAIYAPVLAQVAEVCARERAFWLTGDGPGTELPLVSKDRGLVLLERPESAARYLGAWRRLRIAHEEVDPAYARAAAQIDEAFPVATAFFVDDVAVDTGLLAQRLTHRVTSQGAVVRTAARAGVHVADAAVRGVVVNDDELVAADAVVLAAGTAIPDLLAAAGIRHPLKLSWLPTGLTSMSHLDRIVYSLDGDLLGVAPTTTGARLALPGRSAAPGGEDRAGAIAAAAGRRWPHVPWQERLDLVWEPVVELDDGTPANPAGIAVDLGGATGGWTAVRGLHVAACGKWTTVADVARRTVAALAS